MQKTFNIPDPELSSGANAESEQGKAVENNRSMDNYYFFPAGERPEKVEHWWCKTLAYPGTYRIVFECIGADNEMIRTQEKVVRVRVGDPISVHLMEECKGWNQKKTQGKLGCAPTQRTLTVSTLKRRRSMRFAPAHCWAACALCSA